jgi:hypothetical protein
VCRTCRRAFDYLEVACEWAGGGRASGMCSTDVEELEAIEFRYVGNPSADLSFLKYVCSEGRYIIVWSCSIDLL